LNNKEKLEEHRKEYYKENKENYKKYYKEYYRKNRESLIEYQLLYRNENRGISNSWKAYYRAAKLKATPNWANKEKIKNFYKESAKLTKETGILHTVDHIIPLRNPLVCGLHVENNLQILVVSENCSKSNKFEPYMQR
jgi:hypothetical protein